MRDRNLQSNALRGFRTGLGWRGTKRVLGGAVCTSGGIDRWICHPTSQQNQPLTAPPHRVVNRPSLTGTLFLAANSHSYVPAWPALAKGWNRPFFPTGPSSAHVVNRPVNDVSHGGAFGRQVYQGGIDRGHPSPHGLGRNSTLLQSNTPCWRAGKEVTHRQSSPKPTKCRSKDNIGSPKPHENQFLPKVDSWKCRYSSANLRRSDSWRAPSGVRTEGDDAHRL